MFKKLKSYLSSLSTFLKRIMEKIGGLGAKFKFPIITAFSWVFYIIIRIVDERSFYILFKDAHILLMLPKSGGREDVMAMYKGAEDPDFVVCELSQQSIQNVCHVFLDHNVSNNKYVTNDPDIEQKKVEYREFLSKVWRYIDLILDISAVIGFNFKYYAERELHTMLEQRNLPFLVAHKECVLPPAYREIHKQWNKNHVGTFTGRAISVYNKKAKKFIVESDVADDHQVHVTGAPRFDKHHEWRGESLSTSQHTVVFFSFHPSEILPWRDGEWIGDRLHPPITDPFSWKTLNKKSHEAFFKIASNHPECEFIMKSKPGESNKNVVRTYADEHDVEKLDNVEIVLGGSGDQYIKKATVVIGFNSTVILEALAAGKKVIEPRFAEAKTQKAKKFLLNFQDCISQGKSRNDFIQKIKKSINQQPVSSDLTQKDRDLLETYLGNPDGRASKRMRTFLRDHI